MIFDRDVTRKSRGPGRFDLVLMVAGVLSISRATLAEPVLPAGTSLDWSSFAMVMLKLAVLLALIVAAAWVVKRVRRVGHRGGQALEIIDVLPVGPKERILLVRAGATRILVGSTPGGLRTLHRMDEPASFSSEIRRELAERAA